MGSGVRPLVTQSAGAAAGGHAGLRGVLQELFPVVRRLAAGQHRLEDPVGIGLAAVGALPVASGDGHRAASHGSAGAPHRGCPQSEARVVIRQWGIEIHIEITNKAVETVHQIGGDGLEAFGVAADVLLEQGQEWRQCRILLCCVWADACSTTSPLARKE
jgi:hypothetical protein